MIELPFDTEPEFTNEIGVKWWRDHTTTAYARGPDSRGAGLNAQAWFIEEPSGYRTRVLVSESGKVIASGQSMDDIGTKIDVLKFLKRDGECKA